MFPSFSNVETEFPSIINELIILLGFDSRIPSSNCSGIIDLNIGHRP